MIKNDRQIKSWKPDRKLARITDGKGMYLLAPKPWAAGTAPIYYWRLDYVFEGDRKTFSLGTYPDVTLERAREKRTAARRLVDAGIDPSAARKAERKAARIADSAADSFRTVAAEYMAKQQHEIGPGTLEKKQSALDRYLLPTLGDLPIADVKPKHVLAVIQPIDRLSKHETAGRVNQLAGQIFAYAIATDRLEHDPTARLSDALTAATPEHHAALVDPIAIGHLLNALDRCPGSPTVCGALRVLPYVFVRSKELRYAEWAEFEFENPNGPIWRIPGRRMKPIKGRPDRIDHLVPLSRQAAAIFQDLRAITPGRLVFPGFKQPTIPITAEGLLEGLRRMGYGPDDQSIHGFRTIASTRLREIGFEGDLVELQLAHTIANPVRAAYDRAARVPERIAMMQTYADHLDALRAAAAEAAAGRRQLAAGPAVVDITAVRVE